MTKENLKKLYKHYSFLTKGNFTAQDFDKEFEGKDSGFAHVGKLTPDRKQLIISDAKRHLMELIDKYPELAETEKKIPVEPVEPKEEKETKSKGKK